MKDIDHTVETETDEMQLIAWDGRTAKGQPCLILTAETEVAFLVDAPKTGLRGFAVTRPFGPGRIAVLGYLSGSVVQRAAGLRMSGDWLELRHGKAALRLNRDGRVRMEGADVRVDAQGTLALDAAEIMLN